MTTFLDRLRHAAPAEAWAALGDDAAARLERFAHACPLYARLIEDDPRLACWLESPDTPDTLIDLNILLSEMQRERGARPHLERTSPSYPGFLRRLRRRMSMRIAYRDVAGWAAPDVVVEELTRLAEMMVRECYFVATLKANERWGEPWDEAGDRAARFAILGLGKLGGRELNFSSDIDLIYVYEGEGQTRRDGAPTLTPNGEYFQRVAELITQLLNERDGDGFLFRTDLRLRPGGASAPLAPSLMAAEYYYAATGQTWERLAFLKARTVAGDFETGGELLESLHSFRYPRHSPAAMLAEVAAMKLRTEREVVGAGALARDIKSGYGGIREIEFFTQVLQLLHAARFPFLQTHSTTEALRQLVRYDLVAPEDANFLIETYWLLRRVEHRVQMAEEERTHELPEDPAQRDALARSLGFAGLTEFEARLTVMRERVRRHYASLFASDGRFASEPVDLWWPFFADGKVAPPVRARLESWFPSENPDEAARALRWFVRGEETVPLVREQVQRFAGLVPSLDRVLPRLARPRATLAQLSTFADRYGSRNQFLSVCTMNREFIEVLALLFDRSRFIAGLLTRHPEIFDEVLRPEILRKRKDVAARRRELEALAPDGEGSTRRPTEDAAALIAPAGNTPTLIARRWLYVRAEQVRAAIGQLLGFVSDDEIGEELTRLADAVVLDVASRTPGAEHLLIIALGTFGGREMSFGSDLDLVLLGETGGTEEEGAARAFQRQLGASHGGESTYAVDLRLRPHGSDGPLVPTLQTYREYFTRSAQLWERQVLTRARVVAGPVALIAAWDEWLAATVYGRPLTTDEADAAWRMRLRVQHERDVVHPPERAFKTAAGGLVDIEFALQILQLRHGTEHPEVRQPNTRAGWRKLAEAGLVDPVDAKLILEHHRQLQHLEWCLRRDQNRAVNILPETSEDQRAVARWLGYENPDAFWHEHCTRLSQTRAAVIRALEGVVSSTTLETSR